MTIETQIKPEVASFFDEATFTASHVIVEPGGRHCAIVDSVLDYDTASGRTHTVSADKIVAYVRDRGLTTQWILETHAHADHLTAAPYLKDKLGGRIAIGSGITGVQEVFQSVFNLEPEFQPDGSQFDHLFADNETIEIGAMSGRVMHTPGHTPACVSYVIGDAAFVGDTIFMPDFGTARTDFPKGDARTLYQSIRQLLALPPETRLFLCHDYKAPGRDHFAWETTVGDELAGNIHVRDGIGEDEFVDMRETRDKTLHLPALILPSVQINIRAGAMPPPDGNGVSYLKIPLNLL